MATAAVCVTVKEQAEGRSLLLDENVEDGEM